MEELKSMKDFTFGKWIKFKEGFNSFAHYKTWLSILSKEESEKTNLYYLEKYEYWKKNIQLEMD